MRRKHFFKLCLVLCILSTLLCLTSCHTRKGLEKKIIQNLEDCYNTEFECESLSIYGGGADFVCYPTYDPTLLFDGFANSETGGISYDCFVGAIFAKEDTKLMTDYLSKKIEDIYVYGAPVHQTSSGADSIIRRGDYTIDDFRDYAACPNLFFYIFIDISSNTFIDDPGRDYDIISDSVDSMVKYYKDKFDRDICVEMHIYYLSNEEIEYAKEYFTSHIGPDSDFKERISPNYRIILQMGPEENGFYYETLRLTKEEYIEKREGMTLVYCNKTRKEMVERSTHENA